MEELVKAVIEAMPKAGLVEVEVSARHVHLTQGQVEALFGQGTTLIPKRPLSQPGQFLAQQRVTLIGPKGQKEGVAVLGPPRPAGQVELSRSDCAALGIAPVLRQSGQVEGSSPITLAGSNGQVTLQEGAIVAQNHVHMTQAVATALGYADKDTISVEVLTQRPVTFHQVLVRVSDQFATRLHLDVDEANAAQVEGFTLGRMTKTPGSAPGDLTSLKELLTTTPSQTAILEKKLVTQQDLVHLCTPGITQIQVQKRAILTDLAVEFAAHHGISLVRALQ